MSMGTRQNTSTTCAGVSTIGVPTLSEGVDHDWHPGQPRERGDDLAKAGVGGDGLHARRPVAMHDGRG